MDQPHTQQSADASSPAYEIRGDFSSPLIVTAIHAGHDLRPEVAEQMILDEDVRFREEDPFTDQIGEGGQFTHDNPGLPQFTHIAINRSRFEVDLNREPAKAVYRTPQDCWGLEVWRESPLSDELVAGSLAVHEQFYAELGERLDEVAQRGRFVVYDVHSYNHRRPGADEEPEPVEDNPEVNVGTGSLDRELFGPVVEAFMTSLAEVQTSTGTLDVRENVKFSGAYLAQFVHDRYPGVGCALALEFKKTFMDEWTGQPDEERIGELRRALAETHGPVLEALAALPPLEGRG